MRINFYIPQISVDIERVFHYFQIKNRVPAIIKVPPTAVFQLRDSPKKSTAKMMVKAKLNLSTPATLETSPICKALK